MDRFDWDNAARSRDPDHQSCINNSTGHTPGTNNYWDTFHKYPRYPDNKPHGSLGVDVGRERLSPPSHNLQNKRLSQVEVQDGELLEMDSELARKREELRQIEDQIAQKKFCLALKKVEPIIRKTMPGVLCNEEAATCRWESLRNRVNVILQQRQSLGFIKKVQSPREKVTLSSLRKDSLLQEAHPLKLRVKALMKQRGTKPCLQPSTTERENSSDEGFQRFLSILNKGVDMDFLSRIVNDDSEELPSSEELLNIPPTVRNKPGHFRSESRQSNSSSSLPGCNQTGSGEGQDEPPSPERLHNRGLSLPIDEEEQEKNDRRDRCFGSSSRSKSPVAVKKKKKKQKQKEEEVEENSKLDKQREQLQNILKTVGLNLEVEEMRKLADRTQERLYGKKCEGRTEQESQQQRAGHRHYRNASSSSSSFSSSCSSRSSSRTFSSSRSRSRSRDSKPRLECERGRSREDGLKNQEGNLDSRDPHSLRDPSAEPRPPPPPELYSSFHHDILAQYSESTATFHSGSYSANTNSFWTYSQGAAPAPFYSGGFLNQPNAYHHFRGPDAGYSNHTFHNTNALVNPELSTGEGQTGGTSGPHYLQAISRPWAAANSRCKHTPVVESEKKAPNRVCNRGAKAQLGKAQLRRQENFKKKQQIMAEVIKSPDPAQDGSDGSRDNEAAEESQDVKQQPTEEEIKANLRKKLEAFNQKARKNLAQPAAAQLLKSVECHDCV